MSIKKTSLVYVAQVLICLTHIFLLVCFLRDPMQWTNGRFEKLPEKWKLNTWMDVDIIVFAGYLGLLVAVC